PIKQWAAEEGIGDAEIKERLTQAADAKMAQKAANYGADIMRMAEKSLLLQILDQNWKEHLVQLDHLRQGINLRAYAQRDPVNEYKREAFELFSGMLVELRETVTRVLANVELRIQRGEEPEEALPPPRRRRRRLRRLGARRPAMRPVLAAPAKNSSTATAASERGIRRAVFLARRELHRWNAPGARAMPVQRYTDLICGKGWRNARPVYLALRAPSPAAWR